MEQLHSFWVTRNGTDYTVLGDNYYEKFSVFSIFPPFPFPKNILHYGFHDVQV